MLLFLLFGPRPRSNSKKKNHAPAQTATKIHTPPHLPSVFFFAVWAGGVFILLAVRAGGMIFLLFGRGACSFFAVWAGGVFLFFAVWAGCVFFLAVWAGCVFFSLLFERGTGVHSLTGLPGKRPHSKKKKEFPVYPIYPVDPQAQPQILIASSWSARRRLENTLPFKGDLGALQGLYKA